MIQRRSEPTIASIFTIYVSALAQGLTVVSFPASAALFKARGLSDAQYGTLFLPQVAFTVFGSLLGPGLARRIGLGATLSRAFVASSLSACLLYASSVVSPTLALPVLLAGTAAMGAGFGLSAAPLNALPPRLFPQRADAALLALHTLMGVGFSSGPFLAGELLRRNFWRALPLGLALLTTGLLLAARLTLSGAESAAMRQSEAHDPSAGAPPLREGSFWALIAAGVLYAFSEGTFSNWAILFLHEEKQLPDAVAGSALSLFWASLVVGRLLLAVLVVRFSSRQLWLCLPASMIAALLCVSSVQTARQALLAFAFAGLSCSGYFPLTVALATRRYPAHAAWISSMLIAALMFGVGLASFSIGPLRSWFSLAAIYRCSTLYPALALLVGAWPTRSALSHARQTSR